MAARPADRRVLGALATVRRRSGSEVRAQCGDRRQHCFIDRQIAGGLGCERGMGTLERAAQRAVAEHDPTCGARGAAVPFGPRVDELRLDVQDLVRPTLRDRRHPGVDGIGLEHEQLALRRTLLGRVQVEPRRTPLDHRHRPRRVRMGPVRVLHEPGVERLDPVEPLGAEICGVLSGRDAKIREPGTSLSSDRAMSISTNQLKSGNHVEVDGTVYKVIEFQHVNPGKGAAFVRTKLRRASDGAVIDKTFRAGEKLRSVRSESRRMQFLYADGEAAHFMNTETYEQIELPEATLAEALKWIKVNDEVEILFIDEQASDVQVPGSVDLEVTQTDPGLRGDTASGGGTKPATLETGVVVQVPLFISTGERIKVDTREGRYLSRA